MTDDVLETFKLLRLARKKASRLPRQKIQDAVALLIMDRDIYELMFMTYLDKDLMDGVKKIIHNC